MLGPGLVVMVADNDAGGISTYAQAGRAAIAGRLTWTMPPIESLRPPARSAWRTLGLVVLRCYLFAAVIVLAVRALQIALGTG